MDNRHNNKYHEVNKQLSGKNNKRLRANTRVDLSYTQPIFNEETKYEETNVIKPKIEGVIQAKDWVDNGSRT